MSLEVKVKKKETVYVTLPGYPDRIKHGLVEKSVSLDDILSYKGPRVQLDLDREGRLIGIEIVA